METAISHLETVARVQTIDYHGKIQVHILFTAALKK
jgi:hypothetical protein